MGNWLSGMKLESKLFLHNKQKGRARAFLHFLINIEFHVSGPGAQCIGISSMALTKSSGVSSMSEIAGPFPLSLKKKTSGFSILKSVFGLLKTDSHTVLNSEKVGHFLGIVRERAISPF